MPLMDLWLNISHADVTSECTSPRRGGGIVKLRCKHSMGLGGNVCRDKRLGVNNKTGFHGAFPPVCTILQFYVPLRTVRWIFATWSKTAQRTLFIHRK